MPQQRASGAGHHILEEVLRGPERTIAASERQEQRKTATTVSQSFTSARPSASILLISPHNRILLLHRVSSSNSFAAAHVFPGGNVSPQDGPLPDASDPKMHEDSETYRMAAVRECFEESGLLLAKEKGSFGRGTLLELSQADRDAGRKAIHSERSRFDDWVSQHNGVADTASLVPFTRWLTPENISKRHSAQMYIYFLPIESSSQRTGSGDSGAEAHIPTPDGGVEHTAAQFLYPQEWLDLALRNEVVLFPPQFFLLSIVADFLQCPPSDPKLDRSSIMQEQRDNLMTFVETDGDPPWGQKCISPNQIKQEKGNILILGLGDPGPELRMTGRKGDMERVVKVDLESQAERQMPKSRAKQVVWRKDALRNYDGEGKL